MEGLTLTIKCLKEMKPYSTLELQSYFETSQEVTKEIIQKLIASNIIKRINSRDISNEIELSHQIDNIEGQESRFINFIFVFNYVGVIYINEIIFFVYPKYFKNINRDEQNMYNHFSTIIKVIRKYKKKEQLLTLIGETENDGSIGLTISLLEDYHLQGLYTNDSGVINTNNFGEVLWQKTIDENIAFISSGTPVYLELYSLNNERNENDFFTLLHRDILNTVSIKYEYILKLLGVPPVFFEDSLPNTFDEKDFLLYRINQEISNQFISARLNQLKLIKLFFEGANEGESNEDFSFIGTTNFKYIWEDVCSTVFGNNLHHSLEDMGLEYSGMSQYKTLKDCIEKPSWNINKVDGAINSMQTLIPDIVIVDGHDMKILDAKYYDFDVFNNKLIHPPGISDITKQYFYQLAFKNLIKENNMKVVSNDFIFPTDLNQNESIGNVNLDFLDGLVGESTNGIGLVYRNAHSLYVEYLKK